MRLDYWNQPLIVKAIRVKYRGGKLYTVASTYLALLLAGGAVLFYYSNRIGPADWARFYFIGMISLQFVVSAIIAISATSSSMQAEVSTRTLDFQRIASLRPSDILVGKAIGEPAISYLLAMATIPIAVFCIAMGNIPLLSVVMIYITLATTTFLMACLGLQHSLDPAAKSSQAAGVTGAILFGAFMAASMPLAVGPRGGLLELSAAAVGLFTPIFSIKGMAQQGSTIWTAQMPFFDLSLPYAILTPISQLALAVLSLLFMTRRLTQPLDTPLSKLQSYAVLLIADLIWASLQYCALALGEGLTAPAVRFAVGHAVLSLLVAGRVTPNRDTFRSWAWRLRGTRSLWLDHLIGERTLNPVALMVYCALGVAVFTVAIGIPAAVLQPDKLALTDWNGVVSASVTAVLVVLVFGITYQVGALTIGRGAGGSLFLLAGLLVLAPWFVGSVYQIPWLSGLSPLAMFVRLQDQNAASYDLVPFALLYIFLGVLWSLALVTMSRRTVAQVDRRLQSLLANAPSVPQPTLP